MNRDYIEKAIQIINDVIGDNEAAHRLEDELRDWFLTELAKRDDDIGQLAKLVLSTNDIRFARWFA